MSILDFDGVSRWYGHVLGLNKVTCRLEPGITGLLGPNGAGKSTFLKLGLGLLRPSAGHVLTLGEPVWDNPALMARIGYCPEIDDFYESMSGLEFVALMVRLHGFSSREARQRGAAALERVGLEGKDAGRRIRQYSKGMRQKVKLAQALAHDPELLVLDEPFTGADPPSRRRVIDVLKERAAAGVHILLSSHVLYEIEALTRNILLIDRGRVLAEGGIRGIRDLIDEHPHRIRLQCDDPRRLAVLVLGQPFVASVRMLPPGGIEIETAEPGRCYRELPALAVAGGFRLLGLSSEDNDMESVFRYLVEGRLSAAPPAGGAFATRSCSSEGLAEPPVPFRAEASERAQAAEA